MKKTIKKVQYILNDLLIKGEFELGLKAGLSKTDFETKLCKPLGTPFITTPDVDCFYLKMNSGILLEANFDKTDNCIDVIIRFDENENVELKVVIDNDIKLLNKEISLNDLICIISRLKLKWEFDKEKSYRQRICIGLANGLTLYYGFWNEGDNKISYSFYAITSSCEWQSGSPPVAHG